MSQEWRKMQLIQCFNCILQLQRFTVTGFHPDQTMFK